MHTLKQTPSQTVGPFFAYGLCPEQYHFDLKSLFTATVAAPHVAGEHILLVGTVHDGAGQVVPDAVIEFLQADASGHYVTSAADAQKTGFKGFARVGTGTDPDQRYVVETIKPGAAAPGAAPCIDVIVHMRGMLLHAYTRIYFEDEETANAQDEVLATVPAARRPTLIAKREPGSSRKVYRFDIRLQGPNETVFFDV